MSSNDEENQAKTDENKKETVVADVSGTTNSDTSIEKDTTPPKIAKTDNLLNFSLEEASKKKDEKKKEDEGE